MGAERRETGASQLWEGGTILSSHIPLKTSHPRAVIPRGQKMVSISQFVLRDLEGGLGGSTHILLVPLPSVFLIGEFRKMMDPIGTIKK